jgi:hypothetical protein
MLDRLTEAFRIQFPLVPFDPQLSGFLLADDMANQTPHHLLSKQQVAAGFQLSDIVSQMLVVLYD